MSEIVTVARLNNLQSRIALILGRGAGNKGYGQVVSSSQVTRSPLSVAQAEDMNLIFLDLIKARIHQVGYNSYFNSNLKIFEVTKNLNALGLDSSPNILIDNQTGQVSVVTDATSEFKGISDYERLMKAIEDDKFLVDNSQVSLEDAINSVRTTPWRGKIYHEFSVTFSSANQRRYFFNSGGKIFFNFLMSNPGNDTSDEWKTFLSSVETISFNYTETASTQASTSIGNYELTNSYQTIYEASNSGTNTTAKLVIYAKNNSLDAIQFKIEFDDIPPAPATAEPVIGRISSAISYLLPDGIFEYNNKTYTSVSLPSPTFLNLTTLDSFAAPVSVYSLYANKTSVFKNDSFRVTLNTKNLSDGTLIPYTITGITTQDIQGESLTGNFVVDANKAFENFQAADNIAEDKTFQLKLNSLPNKVTVLFNQTPVPLPTNQSRTCISVIDEVSPSPDVIRKSWLAFRTKWPNRPFYLLQPVTSDRTRVRLKIPAEFDADVLAEYQAVSRDGGIVANRSDWFQLCNLDALPNGSKIALFIDTSGSMTLKTVRASYDLFLIKLQQKNMQIITVSNRDENWVSPFDRILD